MVSVAEFCVTALAVRDDGRVVNATRPMAVAQAESLYA